MIANEQDKTLYSVRNIFKSYGNHASALKNVSFSVNKGEFLVILGPSGSGKSTLLNMLGGMDKPDCGQILFCGRNVTRFREKEMLEYRRDNIGFVFQSFNLMNDISALDNVLLQASLTGTQNSAADALSVVGLSEKANSFPTEMSGGEQQRIAIARALVKNPDVLLCDEPTGALDYETGKSILSLFETLCKTQNVTVLFVTHTKEISAMADHVICMRNGKIENEYFRDDKKSAAEIEW